MKIPVLVILFMLSVVFVGYYYRTLKSQKAALKTQTVDPAAVTATLRDKVLRGSPGDFGLKLDPSQSPVWGALMELGYPEGVVTLVGLSDGSQ